MLPRLFSQDGQPINVPEMPQIEFDVNPLLKHETNGRASGESGIVNGWPERGNGRPGQVAEKVTKRPGRPR